MKCAVYIRVSTNQLEQLTSLQNQKEMFIRLIADNGWELYKIYSDKDTGTDGKREGLKELIKDAEGHKFDLVLAKELSRIARNADLSSKLKNIILTNKIHIKTLDNAIDTLEGDFSKFGLYSWLYENESRQTSARIKAAHKSKANRGHFITGDPPYGYKVEEGVLKVKDDETPDIVKEIFRMYLNGYGTDHIAKCLTSRGVRTPLQVKGKCNAGEKWHGSTVKKMLKNIHYIGDLVQCKTTNIDLTFKKRVDVEPIIKKNTHEPIISPVDFWSVQSLIEKKKPFGGDGRATPMIHLFSDLLFCKDCGKKLWYMQNRKGYVCGTFRKYGIQFCSSHSIKEAELVETVREELKFYVNSIAVNKAVILEKIEKKTDENTRNFKKAKEQLEQRNAKAKSQKGSLVLMYVSGEIEKEEYELALQNINEQLFQHQLKLEEFNNITTNADYKNQLKYIEMHLDTYIDLKEISREVLNRFIDNIIVDSNGDIEIYYKFNVQDSRIIQD
jgi:DNA invertase Pin-like site-specific DNA recombinase